MLSQNNNNDGFIKIKKWSFYNTADPFLIDVTEQGIIYFEQDKQKMLLLQPRSFFARNKQD